MAWRSNLSSYEGPIEATLAWFGAGLIPFSVLSVQMFEQLFKDEKHEAWRRATDNRLKALEADVEKLKAAIHGDTDNDTRRRPDGTG